MQRLLIVIILAGLAWSGHWLWSANALRDGTAAWFDARRADGWQAGYDALSLRGFPNRLDVTLDAPHLADPDAGIAWRAPFLQILRLSYRPDHMILIWPEDQTVTLPGGTVDITDQGLRASVVMQRGTILRANAEARMLTLDAPAGSVALADLTAALVHLDAAHYRLAVQTTLPDAGSDALVLGLDGTVTLDRPLDDAVSGGPWPRPERIALRMAQLTLGADSLRVSGDLDLDAQGRASGTLTMPTEGAARVLDALGPRLSTFLAPMKQALALADPSDEVTLTLRDGTVSWGMLTVGRLPPLRLR